MPHLHHDLARVHCSAAHAKPPCCAVLCQYPWQQVSPGIIAARRKWDETGCDVSGNGTKGGSCLWITGVQAEGDGIVRRDEEDARKLAAGIQIAVSGTRHRSGTDTAHRTSHHIQRDGSTRSMLCRCNVQHATYNTQTTRPPVRQPSRGDTSDNGIGHIQQGMRRGIT